MMNKASHRPGRRRTITISLTSAATILLGLILNTTTAAQALDVITARITPGLPKLQQPVTFVATARIQLSYRSRCLWYNVHEGSQTGRVVASSQGTVCSLQPYNVPSGQKLTFTWDQRDRQSAYVLPGTYWIALDTGIGTRPANLPQKMWFCFNIDGGTTPTLTATSDPKLGNVTTGITLTGKPSAFFVQVASFNSNSPITVPGLTVCLSADLLFNATLSAGGGILLGSLGRIPASGTQGLAMALPPLPQLEGVNFVSQALLDDGQAIAISNPWLFAIIK
jgi:hypothetical protein